MNGENVVPLLGLVGVRALHERSAKSRIEFEENLLKLGENA